MKWPQIAALLSAGSYAPASNCFLKKANRFDIGWMGG
jgi:hypothetical protein